MPLFRFHRGGLDESLQTTIVVKTFNDMVRAIVTSNLCDGANDWGLKFKVEAYPNEKECFDPRIGWYTHIVTANLFEEDKMHPIGFLSESLDGY